MRVALFAPTARRCGIADYVRDLRPHLERRCDVDVVAADGRPGATDFTALGTAMNDADVAHVQYEHAFFCENDAPADDVSRFLGQITIPVVMTMHCPPLDDDAWRPILDRPNTTWIAHAASVADALRTRGVRGVIDRTPLPTSHRPTADGEAIRSFREAHGLGGRRVVAIFGFTKRHKGYLLAVEALPAMPDDVVLLVAGGPQDARDAAVLAEARDRAAACGVSERVRVTGYLAETDVRVALGASDVVLAPYELAHGSASVAAALGCERPVVATALPSFRDIEAAYGCLQLFEPRDGPALADATRHVLSDAACRQRRIAGARRYHTAHGFQALAERLHRHGERLVGRHARAAGAA